MTTWCAVSLLIAAAVGAVLVVIWQSARDEVLRLRERCAAEYSAHYQTWRQLSRRERQIGRLHDQVRAMREIAETAALAARLDSLAADSAFAPLDEGA